MAFIEIHQIRDIIKQIAAQGTTILLASHLLDEVESMLSCIGFKKRGHYILVQLMACQQMRILRIASG
jgi:ABC-2 type transport system ATP-binding protein